MSRRASPTWAPTNMPEIRRRWCHAVETVADVTFDEYVSESPPGASPQVVASARRIEKLKAKLAATAHVMKAEAAAVRGAELYWVSRDMVDVVLHAAHSLPEWSPALAAPAPTGLLCWAKSAGTVACGKPDPGQLTINLEDAAETIDLPWDGLRWWTRPQGMQMQPFSRVTDHVGLLGSLKLSSPIWGAHTIMLNPQVPRTDEVNGSEHAHPFVSAIGAAWLLMAQANVAETRTIGPAPHPGPRPQPLDTDPEGGPRPPSEPSTVTIVELRRRPSPRRAPGESGRTLDHRIAVTGYWRQQPCGPGQSQRIPKFIDDHERGPKDASLIVRDRVHESSGTASTFSAIHVLRLIESPQEMTPEENFWMLPAVVAFRLDI
jgi:hypothetical protein